MNELRRRGALIAWDPNHDKYHLAEAVRRRFPEMIIQPPIVVPLDTGAALPPIRIMWGIVYPGRQGMGLTHPAAGRLKPRPARMDFLVERPGGERAPVKWIRPLPTVWKRRSASDLAAAASVDREREVFLVDRLIGPVCQDPLQGRVQLIAQISIGLA